MSVVKKSKRTKVLEDAIRNHNVRYYTKDATLISDAAYDVLVQELTAIYGESVPQDSVLHRIGGPVRKTATIVKRTSRMESLRDVFDTQTLTTFVDNVVDVHKQLGLSGKCEFIVEDKCDGLAVELTYVKGVLTLATTRGDGWAGETVTDNCRTINDLPLTLPKAMLDVYPDTVYVRGEVVMYTSEFDTWNETLAKRGDRTYTSIRSAAAGSLRMADSAAVATRPLHFVAYSVVSDGITRLTSKVSDMSSSFKVVQAYPVTPKGVTSLTDNIRDNRDSRPYPIDGCVVKACDTEVQEHMGSTSSTPRWAVAVKWAPPVSTSKLLDVTYQVGRTGIITPVGVITPTVVGGVLVSTAQLFNMAVIAEKDLKIGDVIRIHRAGEVVPEIIDRVLSERPSDAITITPPTHCPSCNSTTKVDEATGKVWCPNNVSCKDQVVGYFTMAVSRDALDMKGISRKVLERLYDMGRLRTLVDIVSIPQNVWQEAYGGSLVYASTAIRAATCARKQTLRRVLYAMGIPNVGRGTSKRLEGEFGTLERITKCSYDDFIAVTDIGPDTAESLHGFLNDPGNSYDVSQVINTFDIDPPVIKKVCELTGKRVVLTGSFNIMSRGALTTRLEQYGVIVTSGLTTKTDYLIAGIGGGGKRTKAKTLGVSVLTEGEVMQHV